MSNINHTLVTAAPHMIDPDKARNAWDAFRIANGYAAGRPLLSAPSDNMKLGKDATVVAYGLSLAQSTTSGVANVCPYSTKGCRAGCVAKNGNGAFNKTQAARALKVKFLLSDPSAFYTLLASEIDELSAKYGDSLRVRLNTFSDIRHEDVAPWLFDRPVQFYDYTKDWSRHVPANYHLTYSVSERTSLRDAAFAVNVAHRNVAVVFDTKKGDALPAQWCGCRVVDGDKSDNRSNDPRAVVVGLRAKGRMRNDTTGMVRSAS